VRWGLYPIHNALCLGYRAFSLGQEAESVGDDGRGLARRASRATWHLAMNKLPSRPASWLSLRPIQELETVKLRS
jgi:hypothetical protein